MKQIKVKGSHYACGQQIGEACREEIKKLLEVLKSDLPPGQTLEECIELSKEYLALTEKYYTWILEYRIRKTFSYLGNGDKRQYKLRGQ